MSYILINYSLGIHVSHWVPAITALGTLQDRIGRYLGHHLLQEVNAYLYVLHYQNCLVKILKLLFSR